MKAMVLRAVGEPLSLEERPDLNARGGPDQSCAWKLAGFVALICTSSMASCQISSFHSFLGIDARKPPRVLFCLRTLGGFYRGRNIHF